MNSARIALAALFIAGFASLHAAAPDTWAPTGSLVTPTTSQTSTALNSGLVLVAGGCGIPGCGLNIAETYNPATGTWTATQNMHTGRYGHLNRRGAL